MTICRKARSFISRTRFQSTLVGSRLKSRKWMWLSIVAASRLWAEVIAWKSPVNWRLIVFEGSTLLRPPPVAPALAAEDRPHRRLPQRQGHALADPPQPLGKPDRRGRLALAGGSRRDRRDQDQLARLAAGRRDRLEPDLGLVAAVGLEEFLGDVQVTRHLHDRSPSGSVSACHAIRFLASWARPGCPVPWDRSTGRNGSRSSGNTARPRESKGC